MRLLDVAHTLPEARIAPLAELRDRYGISARTHRIFDRLFGLEGTALHPEVALADGLRASARKLLARNPDLHGRVGVVLYCHALNTALPFDAPILADLAEEVFGARPEVLSVTHGSCASAIMALDLLRADPDAPQGEIVVLTGEKCFFELLDYADNDGLFGEVTSAARLRGGTDGAGTQVAGIATGRFAGVYKPMPKASAEDLAAYGAAFLPRLTEAAAAAMAQAGIGPEDVDVVLPTHLSPFTFDKVAARLGVPAGRVRKDNLARMGHCFCGDLFINYDTWRTSPDAPARGAGPAHVLSFAAGMTGSYAAIILRTEGRPT